MSDHPTKLPRLSDDLDAYTKVTPYPFVQKYQLQAELERLQKQEQDRSLWMTPEKKPQSERTTMLVIAIFPVLACVMGLLVFVLASGRASEAGRIMFFCGLLVTLFKWASLTIHLP